MGKIDDAVTSLRNQPQSLVLRSVLERSMDVTMVTYERESLGQATDQEVAALRVIRAIFEGAITSE